MKALTVGLVLGCVVAIGFGAAWAQDAATAPAAGAAAFGKLPLYFVENREVYPDEVRYYIQGADKTLFFTDRGITIALKGKERGWTVKLDLVGANEKARPVGREKQPAVFSYFTGAEKDWKAGLPTFSRIVYRDLWPGIDLVYNGTVNKLKYEFLVAPGADPKQIRLQYRGATSVTATDAGALRVATPEGSFEDAPPLAWQEIAGKRVPVEMAYALGKDGAFGFTVGDYDRAKPLILDPAVIVYCGYIGGSGGEFAWGVALDKARNAYVTGWVSSDQTSFPIKVGPGKVFGGWRDAFVAKVNSAGTGLVYCGYISGDRDDIAYGIAVDAKGYAYVAGYSNSTLKFPVTTYPNPIHRGMNDAFVAKVNPQGTALDYCGFIGGVRADVAHCIAVDAAGNAYVGGMAASDHNSFPVKVGPNVKHAGGTGTRLMDGFVAKLNGKGQIVYCGYIGGNVDDRIHGIAVDASGNAYVAGFTVSTVQNGFPVKLGPGLKHSGGGNDAFVARVNASGQRLDYCGYVGGAGSDWAYAIAIDAAGNAYVTGSTGSDEKSFPVGGGLDPTFNGAYDAYVAKVDVRSAKVVACGYLGGAQTENAYAIAVDRQGCVHVAGQTGSSEQSFPVRLGPDLTANGNSDGFVAKTNAAGNGLVYCGYVGGTAGDQVQAMAVDGLGNAYVVGNTASSQASFPVKVGPDTTYNQGGDAFLAKVGLREGLTVSGTPAPGGAITLHLTARQARSIRYQLATSLKAGSTPIDSRAIGLGVDDLCLISVAGLWPRIFKGYCGTLDGLGKATATIAIPNDSRLKGVSTHSAFVTFDWTWPSGIRSISETRTIRIP